MPFSEKPSELPRGTIRLWRVLSTHLTSAQAGLIMIRDLSQTLLPATSPIHRGVLFAVSKKAIFLDRDGVINVKLPEDRYVRRPSELALLPDVAEALRRLKQLGYLLVIVTNQRGIGRGIMTADDLAAVHDHMNCELSRDDARIDAVYYCPHDIWESCSCRKPEPGLILTAARDLDIDLKASYLVGDSPSDMDAGRRAGTRTVRIAPGTDDDADLAFESLTHFARYLEATEQDFCN